MELTLGDRVFYALTAADADIINRRRTTSQEILHKGSINRPSSGSWPAGAQAHIGNEVHAGDFCAMQVTKVDGSAVNGQVYLDGNDVYWVTHVIEGTHLGQWQSRIPAETAHA